MRHGTIAAGILLLGSCQDSAGDGSPATPLQPGQWEISVEDLAQAIPYSEGPIQYELRNQVRGLSHQWSVCLQPDQAARPAADLLTGNLHARDCDYVRFSMANGEIAAVAQCAGEGSRFTVNGRYSRTGFDVETGAQYRGEQAAYGLDTRTRTTGRRLGECED